jgi:GTP cyclohydrolase I
MHETILSKEEKIQTIAIHFRHIMQALDLDLTDASLRDTPERFAQMYVEELFWGLDPTAFPSMHTFENDAMPEGNGVICIKEIPIKSMCEHHFVPIIGTATVAYIPTTHILGLSKINRLVDYFCRRPQLQERLTAQIADALSRVLATEDIAVALHAEHFCVTLRGIEHPTARTHTQILRGRFKCEPYLAKFIEILSST